MQKCDAENSGSLFVSLDLIWGTWAQFTQITLMLKYLQNRYNSTLKGPRNYSKKLI